MCKPRQVEVTTTLPVRESWEREVRRIAQASVVLSSKARTHRQLIRTAMLDERDLWPLHHVCRVIRQVLKGMARYG